MLMKVELKLSNDTIIAVNQLLCQVYLLPASIDQQVKLMRSIIYDVADRFDKKVKTQIKKASLFDAKKRTKFTLQFHEAWALKEVLQSLYATLSNPYQQSLIQTVINTLDQKLV